MLTVLATVGRVAVSFGSMPLDPALAAIGGTAVGGFITWAVERSRWNRQQSVRWDETRRTVYAETLVTLEGLEGHVYSAYRSRQVKAGSEAKDLKSCLDDLDKLRASSAEIDIVSSGKIAKLARDQKMLSSDLITLAAFEEDRDRWDDKLQEWRDNYFAFIKEIRQELNIQ